MRTRSLVVMAAVVSSLLGAGVAYLALTIPNDIAGAALLKQARKSIQAGHHDAARSSLLKIVQQYPRTDAAAAATAALVTLADQERRGLADDLAAVRRDAASQKLQLDTLTQKLNELAAKPPPAPVIVTVPAPAPAPPPAPKKEAPKPAGKKKRHR
jgi:hypothetical protein